MTNQERLNEAVEQFKSQMAKDKIDKSDDWKKAYLNRINLHKQSINRSVQCPN